MRHDDAVPAVRGRRVDTATRRSARVAAAVPSAIRRRGIIVMVAVADYGGDRNERRRWGRPPWEPRTPSSVRRVGTAADRRWTAFVVWRDTCSLFIFILAGQPLDQVPGKVYKQANANHCGHDDPTGRG